jgi:CHAT domain-containing protein/Tfp pilus assembly protein PilF
LDLGIFGKRASCEVRTGGVPDRKLPIVVEAGLMIRYFWPILLLFACAAASQTATPANSADELLAKARQLYTQEGPTPALPQFEKALEMYRAANDRRATAVTLGYIANCHRRLGNLKQALEFAQQALAMKEELGDRGEIGKTHNQIGLIYWDMADYPSAIKQLEQSIDIGSSLHDPQLEGSALNNLGLVFDERGEYQRSLQQYQRALELHRSSHFERGEGDTLGNIGGIHLLLGEFREALTYYRQALAISQRLGLKPAQSDDLGNIALCLEGTGEIDESLATFDRALQIAHESGLSKEEADWHKGKGSTLVGLGRYDAALTEYAKAQQAYESSGLKRELIESLNDTGRVYELLGDATAAEKQFQRAQELAQSIGNASGVATSLVALGDMERRRKQYDAADKYFARALDSVKAGQDEGNVIPALVERAFNDLDRKRLEPALQGAREANRIAEELGDRPAFALASYLLGEVYRTRGEFQQALDQYASAENLQKQLHDPELGWRVLFGRGQTLEALGKNDGALSAYQASVGFIEQTRSEISEERFRAGYIEDRFQVYVALVELLLKLGKPDDAFFYSEKLRARAYLDQLGGGVPLGNDSGQQQRARELSEQIRTLRRELEKEYSVSEKQRRGQALDLFATELDQAERAYQELLDSARSTPSGKSPQSVPASAEIQHLLPPATALIEYVVGKEALSILTVKAESVVGTTVPVNSASLSSRTELMRGLILSRSPAWIGPAEGLQRLLIAPLQRAGYLRSIQRLIIVPDGVLNYVPFAALPTSSSMVLGDSFVIAYLPAAAALATARTKESSGRTLLAMAPSDAHLPNATREVRSIGGLFPRGSLVVAGQGATETLFKRVAGDYDYLHLATHGSLNRNAPWLSSLQLQPDDQNDGRLELYEILNLKLHARLVTLSACETALGSGFFTDTPAGDEFVGITRAFLGAGSRSVLASLWAVNDESTRDLMIRFYQHLRDSGGADALARAQREIRRSDNRYRNPYYWAAFVLVGGNEIIPEK